MKPRRTLRYWRNLLLFSLASLFLACLALQFIAFPILMARGYAHPKRLRVCCSTPADMGLVYEDVAITTADGLTLRGWYMPAKNEAAVILLHPVAANRIAMLDLAFMFTQHGYGALVMDIRAHGESDGDVLPFGGEEGLDVQAAASYLLQRPDVQNGKIGVMGWSLGAQVGIIGAAQNPEILAVIADAPGATDFEDWPPPKTPVEFFYVPFDFVFYQVQPWFTGVKDPLSLREALAQIAPRPMLIIGGGSEERGVSHLYEAARQPKELWIIPEAGHIQGFRIRRQEYERRVIEFFAWALD